MKAPELLEKFLDHARKRGRPVQATISREAAVSDLGLDSLALMETIADLEAEIGVMIPDEDLMRLRTLGEFVDRVAQLLSSRGARFS
jgi:acyl carrier protein